ncbi:MAG: hypothetical protein R6U13_15835 [Desulfatiglandaceae bacterium]
MTFPAKGLALGVTVYLLFGVASCQRQSEGEVELKIPHGYVSTLEIHLEGRLYGFGPFVGYYFKPEDSQDLSRLSFVCFNERGFYTKDIPINELLYEGVAKLARLPEDGVVIPSDGARIHPIFFSEAPTQWLENRPEPQDEFLHFHSCYDSQGPALTGYWLRHEAKADFTYDMGERVGPDSPLYHKVRPGIDKLFPRIIEFDRGPE